MTLLRKITLFVCLGLLFPVFLVAQRSFTVDDLVQWKRITERALSNDGKWVVATVAPWEGDMTVRLYNAKGEEVGTYAPAEKPAFSFSSAYLLVTKTTPKTVLDSLKIAKTKKDKMPLNSLVIRHLAGGEEVIDSVKSYRLAEEADWIAYQRGQKDSTLIVRSLDGHQSYTYPAVSEFQFARKSGVLYYVSKGDTLGVKAGIYTFDPQAGISHLVKEGEGVFKQMALTEKGDRLAFLYAAEKDSTWHAMDLWMAEGGRPAERLADRSNPAFPAGWVISENGRLSFSKAGDRLFFGTAPEPKQKDTTRLADDWPHVQVWSWNEPVQYTVQNFNKERDLKKSFQAVYNLNHRRIIQLANEETPDIALPEKGDIALLFNSRPYSLSSMWEYRSRQDIYTVSLETGERKLLKEADFAMPRISPAGKYAAWYQSTDSCWYTMDLAKGETYRLTTPQSFPAWDEDNDTPDYPRAHGLAGWTEEDKQLLIYDRYDIWRFDPQGKAAPVNLTVNGRKEQTQYRLLRLDPEERFIDTSKNQLLSGFNETTKGSGYYEVKLTSPATPKTLLAGNFMLRMPTKAKNADAIVYTTETFEQYPELYLTNRSFKKAIQLTHEGEQQKAFKWGTAELVSWISMDGKRLEGVVYKPADFDPNKKYPLIVNFYERNAETYYNYRMPDAHRSTIDYRLYNSHDYIIFNPDVVYSVGQPGADCYNAVMPGISALLQQGYIDEKAIGAQGHSWGAYQVAYLATRTNLFAAIESGAPVVNMFSAYGGIRWGTGLARSFQYEHTQSRIGGTPWTAYREFVESSPLFAMDKVETPILIMHNDNDGHVPWYQGIEYFVALKRLQKPAWLLNYPGEIHWPMKMANRIDFQKRMFQFFDHYLKGSPMPRWMEEGLPAVEQDFELGY
ncbi:prolyl oligopeptidase family serine peptidase [Parabacteroides sp. PF5-6]|uniref:S9 family peptidase n=1 Tax=Parabacteroides sp. PF5-6 TaxID=1742403 RepID=UPI0024054EDD|nr:prolyl oligopeptidase family serine peptidase [Parabacteroides sp. PF5-6]MDF9830813.1 dipeptidyl aminopeptidase/acylaminoacyl peptidase [Parabacteroides sp. PF5-6]